MIGSNILRLSNKLIAGIEEVNFIASFGNSNKKIEITEESYKYDLLRQYADLFTEEERQELRNKIAGINLKSK